MQNGGVGPAELPLKQKRVLDIKLNISCTPEFCMESMKIDLLVCKRVEITKQM